MFIRIMRPKSLYKNVVVILSKDSLKSFWADLKEAIGGTEKDFTRINLGKAIFLLAIPMVLEMIMESVFAIVDILFVAKLGADAIATVGITESILTLIYAIGFGLSIATTAIVSRRIGEHNPENAAISAFQAILAGIVISVLIAVPGIIYSKDLLRLMGASQPVIEKGYMYTALMLGGNSVIMLLFIINAVFRSSGDAAISLRVMVLANVLNIVLDPCFIFGWGPFPELGVMGAAVATNIGRGVGVVYQLYILFRGNHRIKLRLRHMKVSLEIILKLLRLSLGGIFQNLIATSSWIFMVRIISGFGTEVVAGYFIGIRILIFTLLPSWGLANAAGTLVGQNLGAKEPRRAERSVMAAAWFNMILLGLIALIFITNPGLFISLFTKDVAIIQAGITCLRTISYGYVLYALGMVMTQAFNGAGDTRTPTLINLGAFWAIEIPLAYFLALKAGLEEQGVYYAIIVAESILSLTSFYFFRKGHWKERLV
jgi:putative MATE family efflux protein